MDETNELITVDKPRTKWRRRWRELAAVLVACIAPLSGGMAHGYSSPAIPELEKPPSEGGLSLTENQTSWFAACLTIGAIAGGPIASLILDRLGRKVTLISSALPLVVGWLLVISATFDTIWLLDIGRVIVGIGIGMGSAVAPVYIAEVASSELRGLLGSFFQTCIMSGILLSFIISMGVNYTWLAVLCSVCATLLPVFMLLVPETPRWLINAGQPESARRAITWLRNYGDENMAATEFNTLINNMHATEEAFTLKHLFTDRKVRKPLLLSVLLMMFQQFGGMNALAFYVEPILIKAGFGDFAAIMSVLLAAIVVIGTFGSSFLLDHIGRKKMLIISGLVMCFSCVAFGGYSLLVQRHLVSKSEWYMKTLALFSLSLYIAGFSGGWGPAPWVIMSEILPNKARGVGSSIATTANWICAFIVVKGFHFLENTITNTGTFFLFAGINLSAVIFAAIFVPETKGKSLEDIEKELIGDKRLQSVTSEDQAEKEP